jgi:hypothetical protein
MSAVAFGIVGKIIDAAVSRIWPDPVEQAKVQLELAKLAQAGEFKELEFELAQMTGQMEINKAEAASGDRFTSGWRPFIGWICGTAFAIQFVVGPVVVFGSKLAGKALEFPTMDWDQLMPVLFGMLGLGAYRTYEKVKGKN